MKRLKIFSKTFLYTFSIMLLITIIAHVLLYVLAPKMVISIDNTEKAADSGIYITSVVDQTQLVTQTITRALPISLACCVVVSVICSLLFSKAFTIPIKRISANTERMAQLDSTVSCEVDSADEIGVLAGNINELYQSLLSTIENLQAEKKKVSESEKSKVDFLRAASHELKTPVTALNAILENMILGIGKYQDYDTYLPECKAMTERLGTMIRDILDTSKAGLSVENEAAVGFNISDFLTALCEPYRLIAKANGIVFDLDVSNGFDVVLPRHQFSKAVSNVLSNAVSYTEKGGLVSVYIDEHSIVVENECEPITPENLRHVFEPFYRPDYSRNRDDGGNGLGLYIVDTLLNAINIQYSFRPIEKPKGMRFTIQL
ncbi:Sensor histidine kinase RcsC [bioreactor metagenome]|uniref:histidine kinase n=1 Tax=bioreactor metagenome TaxID=1076179 RepID=A0A644XR65_9ZZZZ